MHPVNHGQRLLSQQGGLAGFLMGAIDRSGEAPRADPPALLRLAEEGLTACQALWPGEMLSCRVEDLAQNPETELARLAQALGLPADEAAIAAIVKPEASPFAGPGPLGAQHAGDILPLPQLRAELLPADTPLGDLPWAEGSGGLPEDVRELAGAQGYG